MRQASQRTTSRVASSAQWRSSTSSTVGSAASSRWTASKTASRSAPASAAATRGPPTARAMSRNGPRVRGVPRSSQTPASTRAWARAASAKARTRAVLPFPASPETSTTDPRPRPARPRASPRRPSSASRSSSRALMGTIEADECRGCAAGSGGRLALVLAGGGGGHLLGRDLDAGLVEGDLEAGPELAGDLPLLQRAGLGDQPDPDAVRAELLDPPDLGLLEDLGRPALVHVQLVGDPLDGPGGVVQVGRVGDLDVDQGPGPALGAVADPADLAVGDVPEGAADVPQAGRAQPHPFHGAGGRAGVDHVPDPYWSSMSMKMPEMKSRTRFWEPNPTAHPTVA